MTRKIVLFAKIRKNPSRILIRSAKYSKRKHFFVLILSSYLHYSAALTPQYKAPYTTGLQPE
jgi:hypothetical protein